MHKSTVFLILILSFLAALLGYNYFYQPFAGPNEPQEEVQVVDVQEPAERIDPITKALQSLTPEQKIAQLMLVPIEVDQVFELNKNKPEAISQFETASPSATTFQYTNTATPSAQTADSINSAFDSELAFSQWLENLSPGGVTLFGSNLTKVAAESVIVDINSILLEQNSTLGLEQTHPIIAVDHEGGVTQRFTGEGFTRLPSWRLQCDLNLIDAEQLWQVSAQELTEIGVNMVLSPVVDFADSNPILGSRICSGNPEEVAIHSLAWYSTFSQFGVQPVFKHFPGIGSTTVDLHTNFESVTVGPEEAALYETLINAVNEMEHQPTLAVMTSHVGVSNQFAEIPCSLSEACLQELKSVAPEVLVVSDALEMEATRGEDRSLTDVTRLAIRAGNHVLVYGPGIDPEEFTEIQTRLGALYSQSPTFRASVDEALTRVLTYKYSKIE